jgi:hypothetical protein
MFLKSNTRILLVILPFLLALRFNTYAQTGKDGSETITTTNVILNRYDKLSASASAGATTITVSNIANLAASAIAGAANDPYTTNALSIGDVLMIIKMQGASISTANDWTYGSVTSYNNTGVYEFALVSSISGNSITLFSGLSYTYSLGGTQRVQVVRVPRLSSLTINSGASLTGQAWSSSYTGGIVAVEVSGNAVVNGTITANAIGFRAGQVIDQNDYTGVYAGYVSTLIKNGAEKGEGIAGSHSDYDALTGRYAKGAAANGGGGGNFHNAGGGGGANAGNIALWTGYGTPDTSVAAWKPAWNLDTARPSFWTSSSSGGGRGGYTYSARDRNANTISPGDNFWGGDGRRNVGGLGGRPLTYSTNTLFMGGGGGAGCANQSSGSSGGNGGGIVHLTVTGTLSGSGSITANGATAGNSVVQHKDGLGGGGAGGAIKLNVQISISGVSLYANGGNGGSQQYSTPVDEAEGPGGGGGAGYIGVTGSPSITMSVVGGVNGTTNSTGLTEFLPNGATKAGPGTGTTGLSYSSPPDIVLPVSLKCFTITTKADNKLQIDWTVYDEINVRDYELEQDAGDGLWKNICSIPSRSMSGSIKQYSITVSAPTKNVYFRLKATDINGAYKYSCTKSFKPSAMAGIAIAQSAQSIQIIHPNKIYSFRLYNSTGQEIKNVIHKESGTSTTINKSLLAKGLYYLEISIGGERTVFDILN